MITTFAILAGLCVAFMVLSDDKEDKIDFGVLSIIFTIICMTALIIDEIQYLI